jgi:hypothetical protein
MHTTMLIGAALLARAATQADVASFTSNDGLYCGDGLSRVAESALAIKKGAPTGGLYNTSFGVAGKTCASLGYKFVSGEDRCTPGVTIAFKSSDDAAAFEASEAKALSTFAETYNLPEATAQLMLACTCHPKSSKLVAVRGNCSALNSTIASWIHRDPYNSSYNGMMCDEGPFVLATRSLQVLKGSPQLAMHFADQIAPISCTDQGFPVLFPPVDHCYPPMHIYTRTSPIASDAGVLESEAVEGKLTCNYTMNPASCTTGFPAFAKTHHINDVSILNNNLGCNCLGRSTVGKQMAAACWSGTAADIPHSPVRDWWSGDY